MSEARGEGPGANQQAADQDHLHQIEYLLYQSTQGHHFIFDNSEIARVYSRSADHQELFTAETKDKIQNLLTELLNRPTMLEKRAFLEQLSSEDHELLMRAYFELVETTILAHSKLLH
jgi:hypothetical protein